MTAQPEVKLAHSCEDPPSFSQASSTAEMQQKQYNFFSAGPSPEMQQ